MINRKNWTIWRKNILDSWWLSRLDKVLDKIKRVGIEKLDDIKILIDKNNSLPDNITLKNAVTLMTCAIKDSDRFYSQLFLEEILYDDQT